MRARAAPAANKPKIVENKQEIISKQQPALIFMGEGKTTLQSRWTSVVLSPLVRSLSILKLNIWAFYCYGFNHN